MSKTCLPPRPEAPPQLDGGAPTGPATARRQFIGTLLGAGFALAVQPVQADTVIHTDSRGLVAGPVMLPAADREIPAYQARPAGDGPFPTVLVVQEIFGVHEHIRDVCRRLAHLGYLAIAPELYIRQGDPSAVADVQALLRDLVARVPDAQVMADLDACARHAAAHGGDPARLAITGFCWGGRITWLYAAHNPTVRAAVAWYGRLVGATGPQTPHHPVDIAATLRVPVLGLYGGEDPGIPAQTIEQMRAGLARGRSGSEIHVYPDAPHAFHADYRPSYRAEAAADGWRRLQAWLRRHGV